MKRYPVNFLIKSPQVRLISQTGENLGVFSLSNALAKSREEGLDLVEISSHVTPTICKIIDFKKFLYQEKQKEKEVNKKTHKVGTKEFRFGPHISDNDLLNKVERAKGFVKDRNNVKITVVFRGREKMFPDIGLQKAKRFVLEMGDLVKCESELQYKAGFIGVMMTPK